MFVSHLAWRVRHISRPMPFEFQIRHVAIPILAARLPISPEFATLIIGKIPHLYMSFPRSLRRIIDTNFEPPRETQCISAPWARSNTDRTPHCPIRTRGLGRPQHRLRNTPAFIRGAKAKPNPPGATGIALAFRYGGADILRPSLKPISHNGSRFRNYKNAPCVRSLPIFAISAL